MTQKLKRYEFELTSGYIYEDQQGEYVKFSDIEPLIENLKFYAKGKHWELLPIIGESVIDKGTKARQALASVGVE